MAMVSSPCASNAFTHHGRDTTSEVATSDAVLVPSSAPPSLVCTPFPLIHVIHSLGQPSRSFDFSFQIAKAQRRQLLAGSRRSGAPQSLCSSLPLAEPSFSLSCKSSCSCFSEESEGASGHTEKKCTLARKPVPKLSKREILLACESGICSHDTEKFPKSDHAWNREKHSDHDPQKPKFAARGLTPGHPDTTVPTFPQPAPHPTYHLQPRRPHSGRSESTRRASRRSRRTSHPPWESLVPRAQ